MPKSENPPKTEDNDLHQSAGKTSPHKIVVLLSSTFSPASIEHARLAEQPSAFTQPSFGQTDSLLSFLVRQNRRTACLYNLY